MEYDEIFKVTLGMFNLDPENANKLNADLIQSVFIQVLWAYDLCKKAYDEKMSSKHENQND
jgi:hypothetical protein